MAVKPVEEIYLSEDEVKVIIDVFSKLDLTLEDAEVILPIDKKLKYSLTQTELEPSKKIKLGKNKIELNNV